MAAQARARGVLDELGRHPDRAWFGDLEAEAQAIAGRATAARGDWAAARAHLEDALRILAERQAATSPRLLEVRTALSRLR